VAQIRDQLLPFVLRGSHLPLPSPNFLQPLFSPLTLLSSESASWKHFPFLRPVASFSSRNFPPHLPRIFALISYSKFAPPLDLVSAFRRRGPETPTSMRPEAIVLSFFLLFLPILWSDPSTPTEHFRTLSKQDPSTQIHFLRPRFCSSSIVSAERFSL